MFRVKKAQTLKNIQHHKESLSAEEIRQSEASQYVEETTDPEHSILGATQNTFSAIVGAGSQAIRGALSAVTGVIFDGKVPITGFHPHTTKVDTQVAAAYLLNEGPPLSSLATNVNHQDGVTWYDITPGVGPKFAWKGEGVKTFKLGNEEVTIVKMKIGDDEKTGAQSAYEGHSYVVFGKGWTAEHWSQTKAKNPVAEFLAETGHNAIVDGFILLRNGFRGLAKDAKRNIENYPQDKINEVFSRHTELQVSPNLVHFLSDPKATGMSDEMRIHVLNELHGQGRMEGSENIQRVSDLLTGKH